MHNRTVKKYRSRTGGYASMPNTPVREDLGVNLFSDMPVDLNAVTQKLQSFSLKRKRDAEMEEVSEPEAKKQRTGMTVWIGGIRPLEAIDPSQSFLVQESFFTKPRQKFTLSPGVASSAGAQSMDLDDPTPQAVFVFGKKI